MERGEGLTQISPDDIELDDPDLDEHIAEARKRYREQLKSLPTLKETEVMYTAYLKKMGQLKDRYYKNDHQLSTLKADIEATEYNIKLVASGKQPKGFPEDPVECLNVLTSWLGKHVESVNAIISDNQKMIIDHTIRSREQEDIYNHLKTRCDTLTKLKLNNKS